MGACLGRDRKTVTSSNGFSDHEVNNEENSSGNNSVVRRIIRSRSLPENEHEIIKSCIFDEIGLIHKPTTCMVTQLKLKS